MANHTQSADISVAQTTPGFKETVALLALMISFVALSLDIMIPALPGIGQDLGVQHPNDVQLIISFLVLGLSIGQLAYGPLSDSTGRKPSILAGIIIFLIGCLMSAFASQFSVMLTGRFLQGLGAAAPRSVILAIVRDQYEGRAMARMMSAIMAVFIIVPAIAPSLGQVIFLLSGWRVIFGALMALALIAVIWFMIRQPETLARSRRGAFSVRRLMKGVVETCTNRQALGYTLAAGFIFGAFLGYLTSAQQVFQVVYGLGPQFPLLIGLLAVSIGSASFFNARIVMQWGMRRLARRAVQIIIVLSLCFLAVLYAMDGKSPLWVMMTCFMVMFFCLGILFGNLNALAMQPLGHIAGVGAAVVGSLSNILAVLLSVIIGQSFNGTIMPLVSGFAALGILSALAMYWAESKPQMQHK